MFGFSWRQLSMKREYCKQSVHVVLTKARIIIAYSWWIPTGNSHSFLFTLGPNICLVTSDRKIHQKYKLRMQMIEAVNCVCVKDVYVKLHFRMYGCLERKYCCGISEITPVSLQNHSWAVIDQCENPTKYVSNKQFSMLVTLKAVVFTYIWKMRELKKLQFMKINILF